MSQKSLPMNSIEYSEWIVKCSSHWLQLAIVYRPPYSANHRVTTSTFPEEFATYLNNIILSPETLLITSNFNIKVDVNNDRDAICFAKLLESTGL